jgi:hypothetical protein
MQQTPEEKQKQEARSQEEKFRLVQQSCAEMI